MLNVLLSRRHWCRQVKACLDPPPAVKFHLQHSPSLRHHGSPARSRRPV